MSRNLAISLGVAVATATVLLGSTATASPNPSPTALLGMAASPDPSQITWGLHPSTDGEPDGRVSLRHALDGGSEVTDEVALTNFSEQAATFQIYAGDGTITQDGNFDLAPTDQEATGGGTWITVAATEESSPRDGGGIVLDVPAQTTVAIPVAIRVPAEATPGDHPAGVVAELSSDGSSSMRMTTRVGVRAHLRVTGDILAQLSHEQVSASYQPSWNPFAPGTTTITYTVTNTGNVRLGADSTTAVHGPLDVGAASARSEDREILPGESITHTVQIPSWPTVLTWGALTSSPVTVGDDVVDVPLIAATSAITLWTIPWPQLGLFALAFAAYLLARRHRRRTAQRIQQRIDAAVAAASGTTTAADGDSAAAGSRAEEPGKGGADSDTAGSQDGRSEGALQRS